MKVSKNSISVWPGYVAAISCLVLSLLLLAAIIVSVITQLGMIAAAYRKELVLEALKVFSYPDPQVIQDKVSISALSRTPVPTKTNSPAQLDVPQVAVPQEQLRLVFASTLSSIPESQQSTVAQAIAKMTAPKGGRWRIWAAVAESDELNKRTTFQIMTSLRSLMGRWGVSETAIELRILNLPQLNTGAAPGEVVIYVAPFATSVNTGSRP